VADGHATVDAGPVGRFKVRVGERGAAPGMTATVAIRPEKLQLSPAAPDGAENRLQGTIGAEAYLGDRSHYYIEVPGLARRLAVAYQNVGRSLDNSAATGQRVWLTWPADSGVLLLE